ncbi:MAG TPA: carboxymuconolactone decarboxylase family protein [Planctomycetes bacterium]|nr:carboxymuconolactone decarboxylase family protein [Planctomycetota bacterium]
MSALPPKRLRLIRLSVGIAAGDWDELRRQRRAAPEGEPDRAWREVVLQSHLFCGFPRVVEACEVLRSEGGIGEASAEETLPQGDRFEAGRELFERIYASKADAVRSVLKDYHPTLERWIEGHAYGRVLSRPGLDAATRELCAVATLAALAQDRQLASHARGAVHCGATPAEVEAAIRAVEDLIDADAMRRALRVLERFL